MSLLVGFTAVSAAKTSSVTVIGFKVTIKVVPRVVSRRRSARLASVRIWSP